MRTVALCFYSFLFELHQHVTGILYCRWTIFSSRRMAFNDIVNLSLEEGIVAADMKTAKNIFYLLKLCVSVICFYTQMMLLY